MYLRKILWAKINFEKNQLSFPRCYKIFFGLYWKIRVQGSFFETGQVFLVGGKWCNCLVSSLKYTIVKKWVSKINFCPKLSKKKFILGFLAFFPNFMEESSRLSFLDYFRIFNATHRLLELWQNCYKNLTKTFSIFCKILQFKIMRGIVWMHRKIV